MFFGPIPVSPLESFREEMTDLIAHTCSDRKEAEVIGAALTSLAVGKLQLRLEDVDSLMPYIVSMSKHVAIARDAMIGAIMKAVADFEERQKRIKDGMLLGQKMRAEMSENVKKFPLRYRVRILEGLLSRS